MGDENNIDLIASFLDFTELNTVQYDGINQIIIFELALKLDSKKNYVDFLQEFKKGLNLYFKLNNVKPELFKIETKELHGLGFVRFQRDLSTINLDELKLFVNLANLILGSSIIRDNHTSYIDSKNMKQNFLNLVDSELRKSYSVYRHNGQIFVRNR